MFLTQRQKYVKAMLRAINKARVVYWQGKVKYSKTMGLRVIKRFERVNKTKFDPFNELHIEYITGHADNEHLFYKIKRL